MKKYSKTLFNRGEYTKFARLVFQAYAGSDKATKLQAFKNHYKTINN